MSSIPDISHYFPHRIITDIDLDGIVVPGLTGRFYQRQEGGRTATAGCYSYRDVELLLAWGYRDEPHCSWTAYRTVRGDWTVPHPGCPRVTARDGDLILSTGEREIVMAATPGWATGRPPFLASGSAPPLPSEQRPTRGGGLRPGRAVGGQAAGCPIAPVMGKVSRSG